MDVLKEAKISSAPIVLNKLIRRFEGNIHLVPYSKLERNQKISTQEICDLFDSDLGASVYDPKKQLFLMYYNDDVKPEIRRFTLAHEYGHILLGHHEQADTNMLSRNTVPQEIYQEYEYEANAFARHLLAPAPLAFSIIDDREENVAAARELGRQAVRFESYEQARAAILNYLENVVS